MLSSRLYDGNPNTIAKVVGADAPAGGTGATGGAYDTAGHRDTAISLINENKTVLNALIDRLRALGINV